MEDSVGSTLEKIKLQEHDEEAKLKEKREMNATVASLNKAIRDALAQIEKSEREQNKLIKDTESLRKKEVLDIIRRDTLSAQLDALKIELKNLQAQCDEGMTMVWDMRSTFCHDIHAEADRCDVWALLMKPTAIESVSRQIKKPQNSSLLEENNKKLRILTEKRAKALAERDRLAKEPDNGEEFIRYFTKQNKFYRFLSTELKENEPIKFSTSDAAKRKVPSVFRNKRVDSMPWYQPYSVVGSVAVFLIYFCILREENDVDQEFSKTLYDRIKGLEKEQLLQSYRYNKENGISVEEIERRLSEIEVEEAKLTA